MMLHTIMLPEGGLGGHQLLIAQTHQCVYVLMTERALGSARLRSRLRSGLRELRELQER